MHPVGGPTVFAVGLGSEMDVTSNVCATRCRAIEWLHYRGQSSLLRENSRPSTGGEQTYIYIFKLIFFGRAVAGKSAAKKPEQNISFIVF